MSSGPVRRRLRELVVRALYQSEICGDPLRQSWEALLESRRLPSDARSYGCNLCHTLEERSAEIDGLVRSHLQNWSFDRLGTTDRGVLRLAVAELLEMKETPARVILDEAVAIARKFGGEGSGSFVNGLLDRVARRLRPGELDEVNAERSES